MSTLASQLAPLYTPLSTAVERLRADHGCGLALLGTSSPGRYAVFPRQVATPSHEVARFLEFAAAFDLIPLFFEFHADKFVTRNRCKFALARMRFADSHSTNGRAEFVTPIDVQSAQGRPFASIHTLWGEPLIDFHHRLLRIAFPSVAHAVFFDGSDWFRSFGPTSADYYRHFLTLFVSDCVLFESYLLHPDEVRFTREIVIPAFHAVHAAHGRVPLIVQLDPPDTEGHDFWLSYPTNIRQTVLEHMPHGHLSRNHRNG